MPITVVPKTLDARANDQVQHPEDRQRVAFWLQSSLQRLFPQSKVPDRAETMEIFTCRNARVSFQACLRNHTAHPLEIECCVKTIPGVAVQVRRVGWVPQKEVTRLTLPSELDSVEHVPGYVPDPLYPESSAKVNRFTNQSFWVTLRVAFDAPVGDHEVEVRFKSEVFAEDVVLTARLVIHSLVIEERRDFPVTHWWNPDCIYDWYQVEPFGEDWWRLVRPYLQNMVDHGSDVIYVPIWNIRREIMKRPPQLLGVTEVSPGQYEFDWKLVRRFVRLAKEIGFKWFEWTHFWAYSHDKSKGASVGTPMPIYTKRNGQMELLFPPDLEATGDVFRGYLEQFLPEFKQFLEEEGIMENSIFHLSDESGTRDIDVENYRRARALLKELAPWITVTDAVFSWIYAQDGLTDHPVPGAKTADQYLERSLPHWVYYCCSPVGPYINRFFDTPLIKVRMQGLIFYRLRTLGFLHWGFNYWYVMNTGFDPQSQVLVNPFEDGSAGGMQPYGDSFVVYPGPNGPIDSIRWEIFAEALQDYALLQTLGIDPDDERLQAISSYGVFPKSEAWLQETIRSICTSPVGEK